MVNVLNGIQQLLMQPNRATVISGAPTASRHVLVSPVDRHLIFFGTETTIGTPSTQDDMFIRFSDQESTSDLYSFRNEYGRYTTTSEWF